MHKLRDARRKAGLSIHRLAELSGVHYVTIQRTETGKTSPSVEIARKLAKVLKLSIEEIC